MQNGRVEGKKVDDMHRLYAKRLRKPMHIMF